LLVEGFETPPVLMMSHNPRYYVNLIEAAGFTKAKDLWAYEGGKPPIPERANRAAKIVRKRSGITLRAFDRTDFQTEVEHIKRIYNASWEQNWGFVPMTDNEIEHMAKQFKPVLIPDLVPFAEKDGEIIGFGLALPDLNFVFRSNRRGGLFPAVPKALWAVYRRRIPRARIVLLGVRPEYRGKGVDAMLWHGLWTGCLKNGIPWGEASWILEDNPAMSNAAERMSFTRYKTYRLYDRNL
jgi:GNAT superfamily N-acetyltransferase